MKLRSGSRLRPFDEDPFLWESDSEELRGPDNSAQELQPTEAERVALHLFEAVSLPSSLLLDDPNERLACHLDVGHAAGPGREVHSEDFASNFYELEPEGGRVGFETNPDDSPALARIVVENGRWSLLLSQVMTIIRYVGKMAVQELEPFPMNEGLASNQMGNSYFRLITDPSLAYEHDVACLLVWAEPDDAPARVELLVWPIEKLSGETRPNPAEA